TLLQVGTPRVLITVSGAWSKRLLRRRCSPLDQPLPYRQRGREQLAGRGGIELDLGGTQPTPHRDQVAADEALEHPHRHGKASRWPAVDLLPDLAAWGIDWTSETRSSSTPTNRSGSANARAAMPPRSSAQIHPSGRS